MFFLGDVYVGIVRIFGRKSMDIATDREDPGRKKCI